MTKYKFKEPKSLIIPELGRVEPGQIFEINNPKFLPIFKDSGLFEEIKEVKQTKKVKSDKNEVS